MRGGGLHARGIVVTRPRETAAGLAHRIEAEGGRAILYPAMEIDPPRDAGAARAILERLDEFDLAVFVSPTAAQKALALLQAMGRAWPDGLQAAAIGRASRAELERLGVRGAIAPDTGADSEALLALPALAQVRGKRIAVFRGEGGREMLGDELNSRGASVEYAACYRRNPPREDPARLLGEWRGGRVDALTASSSAGLGHFAEVLARAGEPALLARTPLFVSHPRIADAARRLGALRITTCGPGDEEMVQALVAYFRPA